MSTLAHWYSKDVDDSVSGSFRSESGAKIETKAANANVVLRAVENCRITLKKVKT